MPVSKDLLLAILSMDSYNRGYGEGIKGLGGLGSKIGSATISTDSETVASTKAAAQATGFHAIAYDTDDYGTSYRGTDDYSPAGNTAGGRGDVEKHGCAENGWQGVTTRGATLWSILHRRPAPGNRIGGAFAEFGWRLRGARKSLEVMA